MRYSGSYSGYVQAIRIACLIDSVEWSLRKFFGAIHGVVLELIKLALLADLHHASGENYARVDFALEPNYKATTVLRFLFHCLFCSFERENPQIALDTPSSTGLS
ncbi:hypothetical protein V6N13_099895 [Hibiscus sabdariffa]